LVITFFIALVSFFQFKTKGGSQLKEYCTNLTKEDCRRQTGSFVACDKVSVDVLLGFPALIISLLFEEKKAHTTINAINFIRKQFVH